MANTTSSSKAPINRRQLLATGGAGAALVASALSGCSSAPSASGSASGSAPASQSTKVRVASLKGPTSIGLVSFMDRAKTNNAYDNDYSFEIVASADEILPRVLKGELDIALIPANAAAVLYNKSKAGISCLDINTLGVLFVVTGDSTITQLSNLAGRTVYLTGKGTTPEYAMRYLLSCANLSDQVTLEFKSEATEVVSVLVSDPTAVGVLPQPYATAAQVKNTALHAPIDLTEVWKSYAENNSQLVTGVTIARNEFISQNPQAVREFIKAQSNSVDEVNADPASAATLVVQEGIVDSAPVAQKAIPACHLVCITGTEMKDALSGYLSVLHDADPASVGGELPAADFYYQSSEA